MKKKAAKATKPAKRSTPNRPTDVNQIAHLLVEQSTREHVAATEATAPTQAEISRVMAALGRKGGKIGGKRRAASMNGERRREIALKAARSRWDKHV
jgi:hypothetical protein